MEARKSVGGSLSWTFWGKFGTVLKQTPRNDFAVTNGSRLVGPSHWSFDRARGQRRFVAEYWRDEDIAAEPYRKPASQWQGSYCWRSCWDINFKRRAL